MPLFEVATDQHKALSRKTTDTKKGTPVTTPEAPLPSRFHFLILMSGLRADTVRTATRQHLLNLQRQRIALTKQFLTNAKIYALAAESHAATALVIDLIIQRYPTAPRFASLLVDRLLVGDEALLQALYEEEL